MIPVAELCSNAFKSLQAVIPRDGTFTKYSPVLQFVSASFLSAAVSAAGVAPPLPDPSAVSLAADAIDRVPYGSSVGQTLKSQIWIDEKLAAPQFTRCTNIFASRSQLDINYTKFQEAGKKDEVKAKAQNWLYDMLQGVLSDLPQGCIPKELHVPMPIEAHTRAVFCYAFAFFGEWADKFFPVSGGSSKFYRLVGSPLQGPFLTSNAKFCVGVYDGFKVLKLPYEKCDDVRRFSMYVFLPDAHDGVLELGKRMGSDPDFMVRYIPKTAMRLRDFKIPDGLNDATLFESKVLVWPPSDEHADSGSNCDSFSIPATYMALNGTLEVKEGSGGVKKRAIEVANTDFVADHSFIWAVREDITGVVMFTGHFSDFSLANKYWT